MTHGHRTQADSLPSPEDHTLGEQGSEIFSFGMWVRRRRKALDLTQAAVAQRVGCAEITIRKIEADAVRPSRETAALLARCLAIAPDLHEGFVAAARAERCVDRLGSPLAGTSQAPPVLHLSEPRAAVASVMPPVDQVYDVRGRANPYRGLRAFTYAERGSFAGREAETAAAVAVLTQPGCQQTVLFVTGASGSGKSSFAQAGLAPALLDYYAVRQKTVRPPAVLRPGSHPLAAFADALDQLGLPPVDGSGPAALSTRLVAHTPPDQLNLLILDQFEELFAPDCDVDQRAQLIALLSELPPFAMLRTHIIVTMRADFLPDLFGERALYERAKSGVDLRAMDLAALKTAIQRPLQHRHPDKRCEGALVDQLAVQTARDAAALPLLQVTLEKLFADGALTLGAYTAPVAAGGCGGCIGGALHQRAEQVYHYTARQEQRTEAEQAAITELLLDLVTISLDDDARRALRRSQTLDALLGATPVVQAQRRRLLHELCDARLLSANTLLCDGPIDAQGIQIDLIHESLIANWARLQTAISAQRERLQQRRRFELALHEWQAQGCADAYLLVGVRLSEAEMLQARADVVLRGPDAQALLTRSLARRAARQQELQRQKTQAEAQRRVLAQFRHAFAVVAILLVVALAAMWLAFNREQQTALQRDKAASLAVAGRAQMELAHKNFKLAYSLVLAAVQMSQPADEAPVRLAQAVYTLGTNRTSKMPKNWGLSMAFSPDGTTALFGSEDGALLWWDLASGKVQRTFSASMDGITSVAFSSDGQKALAASRDGTLRLWTLASEYSWQVFRGHPDSIMSVAFSPDGNQALSGFLDGTLQLWNLTEGRVLQTLPGHTGAITSVMFSSDGKQALTGSYDGTMRLWDLDSGHSKVFSGPTGSIWSVAFSPDGKTALSGSEDGTLRLWDLASGLILQTYTGHTNRVYSVVFSPDGKTALSGSEDGTLRLWDLDNAQSPRIFTGHIGGVRSVAYSSDSKAVLSFSYDDTLQQWDIDSTQSSDTFTAHTSGVVCEAYSPDGKTALTGFEDGTLRLWDLASGETVATFTGNPGRVLSVAFSLDGWSAFAEAEDGTIQRWSIIPYAYQVAWLCAHGDVPDLSRLQRAEYLIPADLVLCPKQEL